MVLGKYYFSFQVMVTMVLNLFSLEEVTNISQEFAACIFS